ncbi:MAG TPA: hypothetical protein VFU19_18685, partial [Iamia sp.]|nr:hypothetical protein [Iamia sp.]
LIDPLGLSAEMVITAERARDPQVRDRIRVPVGGLPHDPLPLLSEGLDSQLDEIRPAFSGLVSARALGRLLTALATTLHQGVAVEGLPSATALDRILGARRATTADATLLRPCGFAGGFWADLDAEEVGGWATPSTIAAFAGVIEMGVVAAVDARGVVAWVVNGVQSGDRNEVAALRRVITGQASVLLASVGKGQP